METAKLTAIRSALTALLVALALLLTGCGQEGSPSPGTQAGSTAISSVQTSSTPVSSNSTEGLPSAELPADAASLQATLVPMMATASVLAGSEGNRPQSGLDLLSLDPCKLLTQDDVKSAMGDAPYAPRQMSQAAYHTGCSYVEPTLEENSPRLFLSLDSIDTWDLHPPNVQPIGGIGDAAQTLEFSGWRSLWVLLKSKVVVQLDIYPPDVEKAKQLLSQAIKRLP